VAVLAVWLFGVIEIVNYFVVRLLPAESMDGAGGPTTHAPADEGSGPLPARHCGNARVTRLPP
jgi:hypothetical protein